MTIGKSTGVKNRTFILGVGGFVGRHLARELHANGHNLVGIGSDSKLPSELDNIVNDYISCDLANLSQVQQLPLENAGAIINLAGLANVGASFDNPDLYYRINVAVHTNVCAALKLKENQEARVIAVSTGAVYDSFSPMPLNETSPVIHIGSPYALSKLKMEHELQPFIKSGMDIIVVRPFNHIGPGQSTGFLIPDLVQKLVSAQDADFKVKVGNLSTKRDYTDVRDIARAYRLLLEAPKGSLTRRLYNICSGQSTAGTEILTKLTKLLDLEDKISIEVDKSLIRPNDPIDIYGDHSRLTMDTGWKPTIKLKQTLNDIIAIA